MCDFSMTISQFSMTSHDQIFHLCRFAKKRSENKSVSSPAGGRNCGQSGGCKISFLFSFFFFCKNIIEFFEEKKKNHKS